MIEQAALPLVYIDTSVFIDLLQGIPDRIALPALSRTIKPDPENMQAIEAAFDA